MIDDDQHAAEIQNLWQKVGELEVRLQVVESHLDAEEDPARSQDMNIVSKDSHECSSKEDARQADRTP